MIIVGENEKNNMSVSVRQRDAEFDQQDMGEMSLEQVVNLVKRDEIEGKQPFAIPGLENMEGFKEKEI